MYSWLANQRSDDHMCGFFFCVLYYVPSVHISVYMPIKYILITVSWSSLVAQIIKTLPSMQETQVQSLGQRDPLENGMATHSSTFAWRISWTEKPGGLQSMGLQRVGHDWASNTLIYFKKWKYDASNFVLLFSRLMWLFMMFCGFIWIWELIFLLM